MSVMAFEQAAKARRVLIYRLGSLGDTVVALPALHRVREVFPHAERRLLTNFPVASKAAAASAVLGSSGLVQSYEPYTVGTRNPFTLLGLVWRIRRWKPDVLVYLAAPRGLTAAARDRRFFRVCGIRTMLGLPDTEDLQKTRQLADGLYEREASRLARTLAAIGSPDLDDRGNWSLDLSADEERRADAAIEPLGGQPFLVASLGTKAQANEWGVANWSALCLALRVRFPQHALLLLGAGDEQALCEEAASAWRADGGVLLNLCGAVSPRVSAAVCGRGTLFLGHDSGPLHLAACMGTPAVGIYSARNLSGVWFPFGPRTRAVYHSVDCGGCGLHTCTAQGKKCILSITVSEVLHAVDEVLKT